MARLFVFLCLAVALAAPTLAQPREHTATQPADPEAMPRPSLRAHPTATPLTLDGFLDEPAWAEADSATGFMQYQPRPGYPTTEPTVVRILYDDTYLYVGAKCFDSAADALTVMSLDQDFSTRDNDLFGLTLDTFHDHRNAVLFAVNPAGALADFQAFNDGRNVNRAWEGIVKVKTRVHDWGWTVEMAIPFTTLRFDPADTQDWGINFIRRVRRLNEDGYWAPLARPNRLYKMSQAGTLLDLRGLRRTRNLQVKPYVAGDRTSGALRLPTDDALGFDAGGDLKYGLTPGLTLDLTARTDFSQVEVDQEQLNLTRFATFFPEKRDFFLENEGVFTFGDVAEATHRTGSSTRDFTLFHSRRIGLVEGQTVPVLGGGRLSGRAGRYELGVLDLQTQRTTFLGADTTAVPPENFSVIRLRRNILQSSDIGVIALNRQATDRTGDYNRALGVDANFRLFRYLIANAYLAATDTPGRDGNTAAARLLVGWRDHYWDTAAFVKQVGADFNPEMGFVRRRGVRQAYATIGIHPRPALRLIQELSPYVEADVVTDFHGALETRTFGAGMAADFIDGSRVQAEVEHTFEDLFTAFSVAGTTIPVGEHTFTTASISAESSAGRPFSAKLRLGGGGFFDGTRRSARADVLWRASEHLSLDLFAEHNRIARAGDHFDADLLGLRVRYAFSTKFFTSAFVQYNRATEQLVTNVRVNLIHAPLSDVFLVFSERRDVAAADVLERSVTLKITRMFAF